MKFLNDWHNFFTEKKKKKIYSLIFFTLQKVDDQEKFCEILQSHVRKIGTHMHQWKAPLPDQLGKNEGNFMPSTTKGWFLENLSDALIQKNINVGCN